MDSDGGSIRPRDVDEAEPDMVPAGGAVSAERADRRFVAVPGRPVGLLALDIDGTLLGPGGHLSPRTVRAVHAAAEAGWLVTLATGRRWTTARHVADELGLRVPLVVFNGAVVRDSVSGDILHYRPLAADAVAAVVLHLAAHALQPVLYEDVRRGERLFTGPSEADGPIVGAWLRDVAARFGPVVRYADHAELARVGGVVRVLAQDAADRVAPAVAAWAPGGTPLAVRVLAEPPDPHGAVMVEFLHPDGTKAAALSVLAARYGLTMRDVVAVGDGINDREMLAEAGVGVAMGQASALVRAEANVVIGGHADDGLAGFVEAELLARTGFPDHLRRR